MMVLWIPLALFFVPLAYFVLRGRARRRFAGRDIVAEAERRLAVKSGDASGLAEVEALARQARRGPGTIEASA